MSRPKVVGIRNQVKQRIGLGHPGGGAARASRQSSMSRHD
jgi:hypothetical protein